MNRRFLCLVLLLALLLILVPPVAALPRFDKSIVIHMRVNDGKFAACSSEIVYYPAPHLYPIGGDYSGVLVAGNGSILTTVPIWDPRHQFGDEITNISESACPGGIRGYQDTVNFVVILPFHRNLTAFYLTDRTTNSTLADVDLEPTIVEFFKKYPGDPDNPYGVGEYPVRRSSLPAATTRAPPGAGPDSVGWILSVISGGLIILVLAAVVYGLYRRQR